VDRLPLTLINSFFERSWQTILQANVFCSTYVFYPKENNPEGYQNAQQNIRQVNYTYNSNVFTATSRALLAPDTSDFASSFQLMALASEKPFKRHDGYFYLEEILEQKEYEGRTKEELLSTDRSGFISRMFNNYPRTLKTKVNLDCRQSCSVSSFVHAAGYPVLTNNVSGSCKALRN
jgi:hypothetical protein